MFGRRHMRQGAGQPRVMTIVQRRTLCAARSERTRRLVRPQQVLHRHYCIAAAAVTAAAARAGGEHELETAARRSRLCDAHDDGVAASAATVTQGREQQAAGGCFITPRACSSNHAASKPQPVCRVCAGAYGACRQLLSACCCCRLRHRREATHAHALRHPRVRDVCASSKQMAKGGGEAVRPPRGRGASPLAQQQPPRRRSTRCSVDSFCTL